LPTLYSWMLLHSSTCSLNSSAQTVSLNKILWQIDAAMQQPATDSNVSYATDFFRTHETRKYKSIATQRRSRTDISTATNTGNS
jgi:hypothetical protein